MLTKIQRDICIIEYRKFPLIAYDKETDTEVYYYPEYDYFYWIKPEKQSSKRLISELIKLLEKLRLENLIFLGADNKPWISKFISNRNKKPLLKTIEYFKSHKINNKFNGGVLMDLKDLKEFLPHFYTITKCDGGFLDYYFMDKKQNIIFYLHYRGEIKVHPLNNMINKKFLEIIKEMKFVDSFREDTDRI
ncbi:hypothetical protein SD427_14295 [Chryseobacterium sp. JJR-5R]|uniref:hypothetical protein n=1 Tax=Chryseobacterium sp. JJR-5R TaxID=3093923 RepID=UPI002A758F01|nr:hypothetical protein [Chryseobacterium sp. JJR-5R]WPO81930.1 hypothetical protein SD427_14295 [Chryseobacterium sp. JJR-5R]